MKKYIIPLVVIFLILISRFIEITPPQVDVPEPKLVCQGKDLTFTVQNLPNVTTEMNCSILTKIRDDYRVQVKPIFQNKCLMCHGNVDKMPLYSLIPPASWLIERDIRKSKMHVNMSYDFPFYSRRPFINLDHQLHGLQRVIESNDMPPWYYELMHWQSDLTSQEKEVIINWIKASQAQLHQ